MVKFGVRKAQEDLCLVLERYIPTDKSEILGFIQAVQSL